MPPPQYIRTCVRIARRLCPLVTLICTVFVVTITIYISQKVSPIFVFLCMQVYLNWYSVYSISCKSNPMKVKETQSNLCSVITQEQQQQQQQQQQQRRFEQLDNMQPPAQDTACKFWHCKHCQSYMYKAAAHCFSCRKCFHFMDHHCFFLGACVLRQNMGNFILFCFYTSLTCLYTLCVIGPYMYESINNIPESESDEDSINIFLIFCLPLASVFEKMWNSSAKFEMSNSHLVLLMTFDTLMSILCICLVIGIWKLHSCLTGKQRYVNVTGRQNVREIFGSYGLSNIIFPYNGLIGTRDINGKYELKEV